MSENELQTGTKKATKDIFQEVVSEALNKEFGHLDEIAKLQDEVKKAFWSGFEIATSTPGLDIQARWDEYKKLRGLG